MMCCLTYFVFCVLCVVLCVCVCVCVCVSVCAFFVFFCLLVFYFGAQGAWGDVSTVASRPGSSGTLL